MADATNTNTESIIPNIVIIKVAIAVPLRRLFDYLLPENYPITPQVGMRVIVPFGKTDKIGLITEIEHLSSLDSYELTQTKQNSAKNPTSTPSSKLKTVIQILDETPLLPASLLKLYLWLEKYYHAPPGEIWQTILPTALLKGKPTQYSRQSRWVITQQGIEVLENNAINKSAVKQKLILEYLNNHSKGISHDQLSEHDIPFSRMKTLAGKKWVERLYTKSDSVVSDDFCNLPSDLKLNQQQQKAIDTVIQSLHKYHTFLLFGVTASGKTEVYLRVIQQVLESGKQALILVPEIGLTPQTVKRFNDRFKVDIVVMHSGMSEMQRLQAWLKSNNGDAKIIIGTRSALFAPMKNPGVIIIDEEHDLSFRQQQGFRYSARDVAMVRGSIEKIPVILGSASPSLESIHNVTKGKVERIDLTEKAKTSAQLNYHVIDLKKQVINQGLSAELISAIAKHIQDKGQVLLFLNRRGYAPVLLCHDCGWSSSCQRCDVHYTYHHQNHFLQCHHCGSNKRTPQSCPQCGCKEMIPVGLGTERLEESIKQIFPEAKVARIDRDTTRKKSAMTDFVSSIKSGDVDILIGTQMLAKGHHFPNITLVALIDMDGALYSADFRAPEYAAQLITQVSGRAGRADKTGEVIIQTHLAEHPMLSQIIYQGYSEFAKNAIAERQQAELPPHAFSAMFQAESPQLNSVKDFLADVKNILDRYSDLKVDLLGPAPAVYVKKAGKFRYQLLLQTIERADLHRLLDLTLQDIEQLKSAKRVRWRVEIDPVGDS